MPGEGYSNPRSQEMSSPRFDPMRELNNMRDSINRVIEETRSFATGGSSHLPVDIYETGDMLVVVTAPLGSVQPETLDVAIAGDQLTISGELRPDESIPPEAYLRRERRAGPFSRKVTLPRTVKPTEAVAEFKNGILKITIPKADAPRPHSVDVKAVD
jgi:HSP20 family protein